MSVFELFRRFFHPPGMRDPFFGGMIEEDEEDEEDDFFLHSPGFGQEPPSSRIRPPVGDPFGFDDIFRDFNELFADFGSMIRDVPRLPGAEPHHRTPGGSLRDFMLKFPDSHLPRESSRLRPWPPAPTHLSGCQDCHLDGGRTLPSLRLLETPSKIKVSSRGLDSILRPEEQSPSSSYFRSVSVSRVMRPDGTVEERKTVRDSDGNTTTTVTVTGSDPPIGFIYEASGNGGINVCCLGLSTPQGVQGCEVPEFLSDYRDVFDEPKSDTLPPHRDCDCAIDLIPGSKFPKGRLFNLSVPEHAAMRSYVKESLEKGHIRPSSSPLGAGFFFVAKKDGSLRPCIDYRLLNKITVKFQYPLSLLSDLFARIKGASWFTKIDLRGAYNLVRIKRGDEWKTAFNTPEGHFEYLVMPFGLANAPSVFQSFMHDIFREYLDKFLIVYLDDILIFSDDWESHVKQVRTVFQVLRANSLFVKGSKCLFGVQKVSFLGFIFSPSTIEMDPVKVQAIHDWTQPTSLKSLQKFLGFANFYRHFICNFSSIAKPLTDLTKKGADVVNWSSAAVEAFQELKHRFSSAPVLCQPDVSLPFQVEVDASEIGAGAVLSQRSSDCSVMKPCAFFSRKFSPAERNYDVGNRELLAMKWAFEEWRHWLEGAKHRVVVLTDHKNLTYLETAKRLNPRQARWSLFLPVLTL
ncbi:unnamed protein product, partial [Ranitomeya imitator]